MRGVDGLSKILLVEGQDDKHVIRHLRRQRGSAAEFDIAEKGGVDNLLNAIGLEIKVPDRKALGIVADANDDPVARWSAISDRLRLSGVAPPQHPSPDGAIMDAIMDGPPRVGVWLMPDNRSPGELEDFVLKMISRDDPVWPLAREYIGDIPREARKFPENKRSRAEVYAWLATREAPGLMGAAIGRGDLETDGTLCAAFLKWIERLFG